jgi:polyhydroxyalkanoate synthesis regulator phasin
MSIEHFQQTLMDSYNSSQDPVVQESAKIAYQYTEMVTAGQLSKEEYTELMKDIYRTNNINKSVQNQEILEYMNVAINGLITLASAV